MTTPGGDSIAALESIYASMSSDDNAWLRRVGTPLVEGLGEGLGVQLWCLQEREGVFGYASHVAIGAPDGFEEAVMGVDARHRPEMTRLLIAATSGRSARALLGEEGWERFTGASGLGAMGLRDSLGITLFDDDATGVGLAVGRRAVGAPTPAKVARMKRILSHLRSGYRLRRAAMRACEAVLTPGGRVLDATGDARSRECREALRDHARAIDAARGKLRRLDPDEALERWRALAHGKWSLVESVEGDGRRVMLAVRNEGAHAARAALSTRERQVALLASQGFGIKDVAYALGVAPSTVGTHLASAMRKLGARTRAELIGLLG